MKSNNLELALRRFEISQENDNISYEHHFCNDFLGVEVESYQIHIDGLYNDYFMNLRNKIDELLFQNIDTSKLFIQTKITLFKDIKEDFELKSNKEGWISNKEGFNSDMERTSNNFSLWRKLKNQRDTVTFFIEMINVNDYYIDKAITELTQLYEIYNPVKVSKITTIDKTKIKDEINHIDVYFEKNFTDKNITNKEIELIFGISRQTIQKWREDGKLIQLSDVGKRPIIYDKRKIIEYLKDGIIKDRLKNI